MNDVSGELSYKLDRLANEEIHQIDVGGLNENARDRNRLCIEVSGRHRGS